MGELGVNLHELPIHVVLDVIVSVAQFHKSHVYEAVRNPMLVQLHALHVGNDGSGEDPDAQGEQLIEW